MHETENAKESATMLADLEARSDATGGRTDTLAEIEIDILRLLDQMSEDTRR